MSAIILDTETHDMNGYPIEIAHVPVNFSNGELAVDKDACFGSRNIKNRYWFVIV
jgi:exodeoxyribonuclease X